MISRTLTLPELGLIAVTRAALGAGVGLLLGDRLSRDQRQAVGWTLLGVGVISTFPLVAMVLTRRPLYRPITHRTRAPVSEQELALASPSGP